jgi:hypothetical protein
MLLGLREGLRRRRLPLRSNKAMRSCCTRTASRKPAAISSPGICRCVRPRGDSRSRPAPIPPKPLSAASFPTDHSTTSQYWSRAPIAMRRNATSNGGTLMLGTVGQPVPSATNLSNRADAARLYRHGLRERRSGFRRTCRQRCPARILGRRRGHRRSRGPHSVLHVLDRGAGFRHTSRLPTDPYAEHGRGLFLIAALTVDFTVAQRRDGGASQRIGAFGRQLSQLRSFQPGGGPNNRSETALWALARIGFQRTSGRKLSTALGPSSLRV